MKKFNITPELLFVALKDKYDDKKYRWFISNILNTDNFILFKKMMIKRNRLIEYECLKLMNVKGLDKKKI